VNVALLDFETTGLDTSTAEVIDGAIRLFDSESEAFIAGYESLNQPTKGIPVEISRITGITAELVHGHQLDWFRFLAMATQAEVLIAHNARFDRQFVRRFGKFEGGRWGCSSSMIDWNAEGMPCRHLKHLLWERGDFSAVQQHQAGSDVSLLWKLLCMKTRAGGERYLDVLIREAHREWVRIYARGAAYESKDRLRGRGFRWSPLKKCWFSETPKDASEETLKWLRDERIADPMVIDCDPTLEAA